MKSHQLQLVWKTQCEEKRNLTQENLDMAKKGKLSETQTESLLIAAQNNAKRTNYVRAKIDKTQQNSKSMLCDERDETMNHINECCKLAQKEYKSRHDWVRKMIHRELCKKLEFDQTNKWYMHNPEWDVQNSLEFWDTNRSPNLGQTSKSSDRQPEKWKRKREPAKQWTLPSGGPHSKTKRKWKDNST